MASQSVVTNYFARKRNNAHKPTTKRQKVASCDSTDGKFCSDNLVIGKTSIQPEEDENERLLVSDKLSCTTECLPTSSTVAPSALDSSVLLSPRKRNAEQSVAHRRGSKRTHSSPKSDNDIGVVNSVLSHSSVKPNAFTKPESAKVLFVKSGNSLKGSEVSKHEFQNLGKSPQKKLVFNPKSNHLQKPLYSNKHCEDADETEKFSASVNDALKKHANLKDLQETLLRLNEQKKKHSSLKNKLVKKRKMSDDEPKEPKSSDKDNKINSSCREYAYVRFHSLSEEIPKGLLLPLKYSVLQEMFKSTDITVSMLFNRQERTTWSRVQQAVKKMTCKNFEKKHLGQIKHVFPDAYSYRLEKKTAICRNDALAEYELMVEPVLSSEISQTSDCQPIKFTGSMLVIRRHNFHSKLLSIVKAHHARFLTQIGQSNSVNQAKIRRWHPEFMLDNLPDIPISDLPQPPDEESHRCNSAKDVLCRARDRLAKRAVDALKKVAENSIKTPEQLVISKSVCENNNNFSKNANTVANDDLKGISQALLAKIRAKESEKKIKAMTRSDEAEAELHKLSVLPDIAKGLRMLFLTEKKGSLPFNYISAKLCKSSPSISTAMCMDEHLRFLLTVVGDHLPWIKIVSIRGQEFLKLDKSIEISAVLSHLQEKVKSLKQL